jgi:glycerol-3-phosphate acyltransferase PlsY
MFDAIDPMLLALAVVGGYLLGSIPFGVIATRLGGAGDVRSIGSGNIGATNVLRTGRKDLALITLVGDGGKGAAAVGLAWLATRETPDARAVIAAVAGGSAFVGHLFPVWLKFKGGKGVATFLGTMLAIMWPVGLAACGTWLIVALVFRFSSLAALVAVLFSPLYVVLLGGPVPYTALAAFMAVLVYIRHDANIRRLMKGEEPKIGGSKQSA